MRKNFTLKTRGVLCCCTGVEIILPCVFLAILCIPKLLVPDSVNNDTVSRPYQLATPWGYDSCAHGYKLLVVPDTADARTLAERAVVNLACDAARSAFPDAPSAGRGKGFIDDILQCGQTPTRCARRIPIFTGRPLRRPRRRRAQHDALRRRRRHHRHVCGVFGRVPARSDVLRRRVRRSVRAVDDGGFRG